VLARRQDNDEHGDVTSDLTQWRGAPAPGRVVLEGRYARLEPLDPARHAGDLLRSAQEPGADDRFRYLFETAPQDDEDFQAWLEKAASTSDPLFFAVVDKATGRAEGRQALMRIDTNHGVIEVGGILWGPAIARTRVASEAFFLAARHVFDDLGYRRFEWKCNDRNLASRHAAARFGFRFEGVFRQHMVAKGENRDTAWFAMTDVDWPTIREGFETWLSPDNFDAYGRQRSRLAVLR
jgi:RimJ/RimL family protein N-acetyltransferase